MKYAPVCSPSTRIMTWESRIGSRAFLCELRQCVHMEQTQHSHAHNHHPRQHLGKLINEQYLFCYVGSSEFECRMQGVIRSELHRRRCISYCLIYFGNKNGRPCRYKNSCIFTKLGSFISKALYKVLPTV